MGRNRSLTREDILRQIRKFAKERGRPPKAHEKGFENVAWATRREFGSWGHALKVAGLQTYRDWKRKKTFAEKIRRLLNGNPMTLKELREELSKNQDFECSILSTKISGAIRQANNINSIGPKRSRVYFLKGQKNLAQTRLDETVPEIPKLQEEIFYQLRHPMTRAQLDRSVSLDEFTNSQKEKIYSYLREFLLAGLIYKVKFEVKGRGHKRFRRCTDFFGNLANKTYYCRFDCSNEVVAFILENLPTEDLDDQSFRVSLRRYLKRILPEDVALRVLGGLPY